jgi:hypothetical protein
MNEKEFFGPALPPECTAESSATEACVQSVQKSPRKRHHSSDSSQSSSSSNTGSSGSSSGSTGKQSPHSSDKSGTGCSAVIDTDRIFGPFIPAGLRTDASDDKQDASNFIGPILPASVSLTQPVVSPNEDDADLVGPLPIVDPEARAQAAVDEIELRAKLMKDKLLGRDLPDQSAVITRDTWMTELPPELTKNFGVTARTFSTKAALSSGDKDRSAWTDTPADRARKEKELREGKCSVPPPTKSIAETVALLNDEVYRGEVDEYNRLVRPKSLLEMHTEKLHDDRSHKSGHSKKRKKKHGKDKEERDKDKKTKKKKKKRKSKKKKKDDSDDEDSESSSKKKKDKKKETKVAVVERRPFDREKDLQVTRMDDAQRKSVIQRSQELSGRFGHGGIQFL